MKQLLIIVLVACLLGIVILHRSHARHISACEFIRTVAAFERADLIYTLAYKGMDPDDILARADAFGREVGKIMDDHGFGDCE